MSAYEPQQAFNSHKDLGGCVLCWLATVGSCDGFSTDPIVFKIAT
jgi:hypothetical protein